MYYFIIKLVDGVEHGVVSMKKTVAPINAF